MHLNLSSKTVSIKWVQIIWSELEFQVRYSGHVLQFEGDFINNVKPAQFNGYSTVNKLETTVCQNSQQAVRSNWSLILRSLLRP